MTTRRTTGRAAIGLVCFLLEVEVGAAAVYLLQHRTKLAQPLYLAVFVLVAFGTLAVTDRLIASRSAPKRRSGSSAPKPPPPG